ncbi:Telomere recombination domain containing protein [Elaphomyces granulatus]
MKIICRLLSGILNSREHPFGRRYWFAKRPFATMAARATRILSVHRLNRLPENQSIAEWWAAEQGTVEAAVVAEAADILRTSDIPVGFPTETVYGLGADATRSSAVRGIYTAKQRPSDNPLIVHVDSIEMVQRLLNPRQVNGVKLSTAEVNVIPPIYQPIISRFWPGPLTILLPNPSHSLLAKEVTSNLATFGVRMPASPFARLLIHVADRPLAAPSANTSTKPSPTTAQHVYHDLKGRIDLVLDGGPCGVGVESTVVDGLSDPPAILRPGGIGIEELRTCPGWENVKIGYHDSSLQLKEAPRAPGMKYRHYSPKAKVVLFDADSNVVSVAKRVLEDLKNPDVSVERVGIIRTRGWALGLGLLPSANTMEQNLPSLPIAKEEVNTHIANNSHDGSVCSSPFIFEVPLSNGEPCAKNTRQVYDISLGKSTESIARRLFSALRTLDELNVHIIYVEGISDADGDLAAAIMNRLRKAAEVEMKI